MKKQISILLVAISTVLAVSGCGGANTQNADNGQTVITVANWPAEEDAKSYENMEEKRKAFEEANPDITIKTTTYQYATDTFLPKAMAGQLPTLYQTYYTEVDKIIEAGYASDITEMMEKYNMSDALATNIRDTVEKNGRLYGVPTQVYVQGLICNVEMFKEAGLVDEDGVPKFPSTYNELAETAATIQEKTGKAGFAIAPTSNTGGWHFMNIAWSNGVEFMAHEDGKWVAKFDTQECYDSLQYVKDLKWKYNVLPTNAFLTMTDLETLFSTNQLAMYFRPCDNASQLINGYGISKDNIAQCRVPEGNAGRVAQIGGTVYMIADNATPEQIDACGKWLDFIGESPRIDAEATEKVENSTKIRVEKGYIVGPKSMPIWDTPEIEQRDQELREKYCNVDLKLFADYEMFDTVEIRPEEPQKCQELYSILDSCIQAVLTDEGADPAELIHQAAEDFQNNYLDKIEADEF